jgi:hypothetical protein
MTMGFLSVISFGTCPTLYNLNSKLSGARASIVVALDAKQNGQAAASIPFAHVSIMPIQHLSHTFFPRRYRLGRRHGMHYPLAFIIVPKVVVDEALAARADR